MKIVRPTPNDVLGLWERIAEARGDQIRTGQDKTYTKFIIPKFIELLLKYKNTPSNILDYGCGSASVSEYFKNNNIDYTGLDIANEFILYANQNYGENGNFLNIPLNVNLDRFLKEKFDAVISIMVLMDVFDVDEYVEQAASVMSDDGVFVFVTTHPCFWPKYWGYENLNWFSYKKEIAIETQFKTSTAGTLDASTIHFHRPLERLYEAFDRSGLKVIELKEPTDETTDDVHVPLELPRFLFGVATKG